MSRNSPCRRRVRPHDISLANWPRKNVHCKTCGILVRKQDPKLRRLKRQGNLPIARDRFGNQFLEKGKVLKECASGHHKYKPGSFEREQKCLHCGRFVTRQGRLQKNAAGEWQWHRGTLRESFGAPGDSEAVASS